MTANPATLLRLATDIEALEGPDREMDARVWCALHPGFERRTGAWVRESGKHWQKAPAYTASIDAALGLLAEVLPGWDCATKTWDIWSRSPYARVTPRQSDHEAGISHAPTLPLAICAAVLRAVAKREGGDG